MALATALSSPASEAYCPPIWSIAPFVALLLTIAIVPLVGRCKHFWESNRNKLLVAAGMGLLTLVYYFFLHPAGQAAGPQPATSATATTGAGTAGAATTMGAEPEAAGGAEAAGAAAGSRLGVIGHVLSSAILEEYVPFIVLLLSLYTISGGILLDGDLPAHPRTNTAFLAAGGILASFIGTTGAAMLMIRPLLHTNRERKHVRHTVVFFIFVVCNVGGCLLPIGDPPLFLGYLKGVPFLWTLRLAAPWAFCMGILLAVYYVWDVRMYRRESPEDIRFDEAERRPLKLMGRRNFLYLLGVVLAVAMLVPGKPAPLLSSLVVPEFLREGVLLALAGLSMLTTSRHIRHANRFTFAAMGEVATLFLGIFITMQAPVEILRVKGPELGLSEPWQFFWASGGLSSFLDNAPTYVVFFEAADSLTHAPGQGILQLLQGQFMRADLLVAISLGSVLMGANTYIGNGPNFMVKTVAEERGVKMPSFFGYMLYSLAVLVPLFLLVTLVFLVL
jgi:Na+/H+ antiporter NhaD/arsenite permease-like protein